MHNSILPRPNSFTLARWSLPEALEAEPAAANASDDLSPDAPADDKPRAALNCVWYEDAAPDGKLRLRCRWVAG
jgi:hypothetical protein